MDEDHDPGVYHNFIAVIDNQYNVLDAFTSFNTGTDFYKFVRLEYDEDGNIWGVDIAGTTTETGWGITNLYRFIMLNNVAIPNESNIYEVKLRKSYIFETGYNDFQADHVILKKSPEEAHYFILGENVRATALNLIMVQINVGSSNEWNKNSYGIMGGVRSDNTDMILTKENDEDVAYIFIDGDNGQDIARLTADTSTGVSLTLNANNIIATKLITSTELFYVDAYNDSCKLYHYDNGTITLIYSNSFYNSVNTCRLKYLNNLLFIYKDYYIDADNRNVVVGCYNDVAYAEELLLELDNTDTTEYEIPMAVVNTYALYTIIFGKQTGTYSIKLTSYVGNYSSTSYEDWNSLQPKVSELYSGSNEDSNLIFARNLYNVITNANTTTATLEIPNTFLNNINITKKDLIGATQILLTTDNDVVSKNIYEALFINFMNNINVIDEDTDTTYLTTATNINSHINALTNIIDNKKIAKIKITYQDATSTTTPIEIVQNSTYDYTLRATLYIAKYIDTIDIISNDETEVYITLDGSSLEVQNIYTFSQNLRIE